MPWKLNDDRPIYLQLADEIRLRIVSGRCPAGERLPSVRDLAAEAAVNPNTMQRAMTELEAEGLVCAQRTAGRTVTEDAGRIRVTRDALAAAHAARFLEQMRSLGYAPAEAGEYLAAMIKEETP